MAISPKGAALSSVAEMLGEIRITHKKA